MSLFYGSVSGISYCKYMRCVLEQFTAWERKFRVRIFKKKIEIPMSLRLYSVIIFGKRIRERIQKPIKGVQQSNAKEASPT